MELLASTETFAFLGGMMGSNAMGGGMMAGVGIMSLLMFVALVFAIVLMARALSRGRS